MAKTIKCKFCKALNDKYAKKCGSCGADLYPEISRKNAEIVTIVLDIIFTVIYLFAVFIFIKNANDNQTPKYINMLPAANTIPYFLIIILFLCFAASKILYILNIFIMKNNIILNIRRISMFIEAVTMFPVQTLFAVYFYEPATKKKDN